MMNNPQSILWKQQTNHSSRTKVCVGLFLENLTCHFHLETNLSLPLLVLRVIAHISTTNCPLY